MFPCLAHFSRRLPKTAVKRGRTFYTAHLSETWASKSVQASENLMQLVNQFIVPLIVGKIRLIFFPLLLNLRLEFYIWNTQKGGNEYLQFMYVTNVAYFAKHFKCDISFSAMKDASVAYLLSYFLPVTFFSLIYLAE